MTLITNKCSARPENTDLRCAFQTESVVWEEMRIENRHRVEDIKQCWISHDSQQRNIYILAICIRNTQTGLKTGQQIEQPCLHFHKNGSWKSRKEKNRPQITMKHRKIRQTLLQNKHIFNIKDTDHQVMQLKDEKAWEKERLKTKEKLKEKFKEIQNCIHLHSQNFASKMLITNRQPARSAPDPGPLPGNIITSWQKNSEVIHYQILKYVLQFDNIQRYINFLQSQLEGISSGWSNTSRELMDSVLGMRRDLFSQTIISIILWSLERSQEGWAYHKKMKNTENIAFPSRFEEPDDSVKWSDREAPARHAAWRLPMLREKNTKNIAGTFCDLQITGGPESPLPRTPPQWDAPFPKVHARLVSFTQFCHLL